MKRIVMAAVVIVLVVAGRRARDKMGSFDWETAFERMPDNAPPKWMFRNISAIRENTDRILELLQHERAGRTEAAQTK